MNRSPLTELLSEHTTVKRMSTEKKNVETLPEWVKLVKSLKKRYARVEDAR